MKLGFQTNRGIGTRANLGVIVLVQDTQVDDQKTDDKRKEDEPHSKWLAKKQE